MVNLAALAKDGPSAELLAKRLQKEVWRGFGYLMGVANSQGGCLLMPVTSLADLDGLKAQTLGMEPYVKIMAYARHLGMSPSRAMTYRKALEEGWAPEPANDAQRAIWQEVKGGGAQAEAQAEGNLSAD